MYHARQSHVTVSHAPTLTEPIRILFYFSIDAIRAHGLRTLTVGSLTVPLEFRGMSIGAIRKHTGALRSPTESRTALCSL